MRLRLHCCRVSTLQCRIIVNFMHYRESLKITRPAMITKSSFLAPSEKAYCAFVSARTRGASRGSITHSIDGPDSCCPDRQALGTVIAVLCSRADGVNVTSM